VKPGLSWYGLGFAAVALGIDYWLSHGVHAGAIVGAVGTMLAACGDSVLQPRK
jgi:hypothetical protein